MKLPVRDAVVASPDYPFSPVAATHKLDQNEAAQDFPAALKAQVLEQLARTEWHRYPDLNSETLAADIAHYERWPADSTVVTTGSNVLIALLIQLVALGGTVLTVKPNFALYGLDARLLGAALIEVPLRDDLSTDIDSMITALQAASAMRAMHAAEDTAPTGVIYLPRPHAPTGSLCGLEELERLAQASAEGWLLVIDEAYHHFAETHALDLARRHPHVVLLRTFSKAWALAGLRLGYALASDGVARQLRKLVPPFAVSVLQGVAAQVALANPGYMLDGVAAALRERERLFSALQTHPHWQVFPSQANFLLIRTPDAAAAYQQLLSHGVLCRRQDSLHLLEGCIRVSIGSREANDAFLAAAGLLVS